MDWTSDPDPPDPTPPAPRRRSFLGMTFECCDIYGRLYRDPDAHQYRGQCPRCGRVVIVPIGPGGTEARFFRG